MKINFLIENLKFEIKKFIYSVNLFNFIQIKFANYFIKISIFFLSVIFLNVFKLQILNLNKPLNLK
jgi:hypothetical protein